MFTLKMYNYSFFILDINFFIVLKFNSRLLITYKTF